MLLNLGPQHPAMHGTLRNVLELDGERIVRANPEIGFLHTGFEKLGEHMSYNQWVTLSDRMNYLSPLNNNIGYAVACNELFGIEFPPRASCILTIMGELSRIADHIICVGLMAMDMGAFSVMLWTFVEREKLYDIFEAVTGQRMMTSYTRVGGVFRDAPPEFPAMVRNFCSKLPSVLDEIEYMLNRNPIWLGRTRGIGVITREDAIEYSLSGPVARASGLARDVRKDRPYLIYRELDFDIVTDTAGDCFARYKVRMGEMRQSLRIIEQALDRLPSGPVKVDDHKISLPPKHLVYTDMEALIHHFKNIMPGHGPRTDRGEIYSCTESPNGELGFFLVSDGTGVPYRLRVRPPSFYNYQIFPKAVEGLMISDAVAVLASLNVIAGELDR